ncbi:MAG: hypothetical protein JWO87_2496 [Phycisphaerales bacterium]|jgi:hypothetical protein|nr:hypothetical protein [Phycisphaerales bacterium]MDB5300833.1 hypothetical protein [Phycisphaerales bacterium]
MVAEISRVLVLRLPADEGNFVYRLAELNGPEAEQLEQKLETGELGSREAAALRQELMRRSGEVLNLAQVMARLPGDFRVVDYTKAC